MKLWRVTAHLVSPIAASHDLHLDAVLGAKARNYMGTYAPSRATPVEELKDPLIPVARLEVRGVTCWLSSAWQFPADAELQQTRLVKRRDGMDAWWLARPWNVASGPGKSRFERVQLVAAPRVSWLVAWGTRRALVQELKRVDQVGAMRRHGHGVVRPKGWEVEEAGDAPPDALLVRDGVAQRHLPAAWCASGHVDHGAFRPPYWHAGLKGPRVRAGAPVEVHGDVLEAVRALVAQG